MSFEVKLKQVMESSGKEQTLACLSDAIAEKKFDPSKNTWSIRRLMETFHGPDWQVQLQNRRLFEGPEAVSASNAISVGILGQFYLSIIKQAYELQKTVAFDLCTEIGVSNMNIGEEVVGYYSSPFNIGSEVPEGGTFPSNLVKSQSVKLDPIKKFGGLISLSYESVMTDKTYELTQQAQMLGQMVRVNQIYDILDTVLGYGNYTFNNSSLQTYYTSATPNAPFVNKITGFSIDSLQAINQLEQTILNQTDPVSGLPIQLLDNKQILVLPQALYKVRSIVGAQNVRYGNYDASTNRFDTYSGNPLVSSEYEIMSDIWTQNYLNSKGVPYVDGANFMILGDFRKAFINRVFRPLQIDTLPTPNTLSLSNDILVQYRAVVMSKAGVMDPRYVAYGAVS